MTPSSPPLSNDSSHSATPSAISASSADALLNELRARYEVRSFARLPREGELGAPNQAFTDLLEEGDDQGALKALLANPELARSQRAPLKGEGASADDAPVPVLSFAALHCCFETAKALIQAGANPLLCDYRGVTTLSGACLGIGVELHHRLLKKREASEWLALRVEFLDWLWEREPELGLYGEAMAARMVGAMVSRDHCRAAFGRSVQSGSLIRSFTKKQACEIAQATGVEHFNAKWKSLSCLDDLVTRRGPFEAAFFENLEVAASRASARQLERASRLCELPHPDLAALLLSRAEQRALERSAPRRARAASRSAPSL